MLLDYNAICQILPHRYPFLMIDRVIDIQAPHSLRAIKNVTINENYFQGHFPSMPVMPGVLQIEAIAQAACILAHVIGEFDPKIHNAYLAGVSDAKFKKVIVPGDQLVIEVKTQGCVKSFHRFMGIITVNQQVACEATIMAAIRSF